LEVAVSTIDEFLALSKDVQEERFKDLLHETILSGTPGVKETAFIMGLSPSTLYNWGSNGSKKVPRPRQLAHLIHLKKNLRILYFFNDLFSLIPFPRPCCLEGIDEVSRLITQVLKETSLVCQAIIDFVDSGSTEGVEITLGKFAEIQRKITSAHQKLAALEEGARMRLKKGPKGKEG